MSSLQGEQESFGATRARVRAAVKEIVLARGCEDLSLEEIAGRAEVREEVLRQHFSSAGDCLLDAYLDFTRDFDRVVFGAFESVEGWRPALRAAAYAAAHYMEENPREIRFGVIGLLGGGPMIQAHRARHLQRLADLVDAGRQELDDPDALGRSVAEAVIGSVNALIVKEFERGGRTRPVDFVPDMLYLAVRPYMGHATAREELATGSVDFDR